MGTYSNDTINMYSKKNYCRKCLIDFNIEHSEPKIIVKIYTVFYYINNI